jgi:acetyl-CoA acetyltransferase family protein
MPDVFIFDALRTPRGRGKAGKGGLSQLHPQELLAQTLNHMADRKKLDKSLVEDVAIGCVSQVKEQGACVARNALIAADWPEDVTGVTVNRFCGSGLEAVNIIAGKIGAGFLDAGIGGGVESMSRVPMGSDDAMIDGLNEKLRKRLFMVPQGISADLIATMWDLSREACDDFGFRSHVRAGTATREGRFRREIAPLKVAVDGGERLLDVDEGIRMEPDRDRMRDLAPAFEAPVWEEMFPGELHWTVTAGNSSQISDGAAAVLIADRSVAESLGLPVRARFVSFALAGDSPILMLTAPIPATRRVLDRAGLALDDIDVVEINEAFASVVLAWKKELGVDDEWFEEHVNPNGGAIAVGHPLGATGTKLLTTMLHELDRRGGRYGLQTMCEGGGMANATIIERLA